MRAPNAAARVLGGGALALVVIAAVVLLLTGGSGYQVRLLFSDASGLVTGDEVMIGPSNVGSVQSIALSDSGQAAIVIALDGDAAPLHRGTVARIEENGLAGIASHYITLQPAAASRPAIRSGGTIPERDTHAEVSLDQLFDALNPATQKGLRNIIRGEATSIKGKSAAANATLHYLAPLLQSSSEVTGELARYEPGFDQLLVRGAQTMQRLASRSQQLTELVDQAEQATGAIARQSGALSSALELLPGTLTKSTRTFAGLRKTLGSLTPLVNASKPAVRQLPQFARALGRLALTATPTLTELADLIQSPSGNGLAELLREAPELESAAGAGFPKIIASMQGQESSGQLGYLLAYTPDIIAALTNIGQDGAYYDANGHYARTEPFYGAYGISGGELTDTLPDDSRNGGKPDRYGGLTVVTDGRCPGGATQPGDSSMPEQVKSPDGSDSCDTHNYPGGVVSRALGLSAVLVAVIVAVVLLLSGTGVVGGGSGAYRVEALFDNAGFAVPGEQVRIAGAPVGTISALSVTRRNLAAVTLSITDKGFTPWYGNATCTIRPQSLIAERYVDCLPGSVGHGALREITSGYGRGSHLLPVTRTSSPIDPDIVQDVSQESVRQSLSLILDQLGTGLAARGSDLNAVIRRADPALAQTDAVFKVLDSQSRVLARLASDSAAVLAPLAKARQSLAGFVTHANTTATATAQRSTQLARSIKLLPPFLTELKPLMADLGQLADQGTPVMTDLGKSAGSLDAEFKQLVPFATQARTALQNLGSAAQRSESSLVASQPLAQQLKSLGSAAQPSSAALESLTSSLDSSGGIQQLMSLLFYGAGATNGYDADGHYVRLTPIVGSCTAYAKVPVSGCSANFSSTSTKSSAIVRAAASKALAAESSSEQALSGLLRYLVGGSSS